MQNSIARPIPRNGFLMILKKDRHVRQSQDRVKLTKKHCKTLSTKYGFEMAITLYNLEENIKFSYTVYLGGVMHVK